MMILLFKQAVTFEIITQDKIYDVKHIRRPTWKTNLHSVPIVTLEKTTFFRLILFNTDSLNEDALEFKTWIAGIKAN